MPRFSPPFILIGIPSNLWMKRIRASRHMPVLVFLWGIITILQGTVKNFGGFVANRFMLSLVTGMSTGMLHRRLLTRLVHISGGLSPGLTLYLAGIYRREDMQFRMCFMYCAAALAGAFSGLLAAAI